MLVSYGYTPMGVIATRLSVDPKLENIFYFLKAYELLVF